MKFFLLSCLLAMVIMTCQAQMRLDPPMRVPYGRRLNHRRLNNNLNHNLLYNRRTIPGFGYGGLGGMLGGGIGGGISGGLSAGLDAGIDAGIGAGAYGYGGVGGGLYGGGPYYG